MPTQSTSRLLFTVKQLSQKHPAFSLSSLRNLLFKAKPRMTSIGAIQGNGLEKAVIRVGRKILIDEIIFFEWLDDQKNGSGHVIK